MLFRSNMSYALTCHMHFKVYLIFFLLEGMKLLLVGNFDIMSFKKLFKAKNNFKAEVGIKNS